MKALLLLVILATITDVVPCDSICSICPQPFWPVMNECFYVFQHKKVAWQKARELCQAMGGDLAEPRRPVALTLHMKDKGYNSWLHLGAFKPSRGNWTWLSGLSMNNFNQWSHSQPDYPNGHEVEYCLHYWPDGYIPFIADFGCNNALGFVCQYLF